MPKICAPPRIHVSCYAGARAFAPRVRTALGALGYVLDMAPPKASDDEPSRVGDIILVDERSWDRVPEAEHCNKPILLLTGVRPRPIKDSRVVGSLQRPAELIPLFRALQEALEVHPRRAPRIETLISARCIQADRRWVAAVVSISERGCLIHTSQELDSGARMNLQLALPSVGLVATRAECVRRQEDGLALTFSDPSPGLRDSINSYVAEQLTVA